MSFKDWSSAQKTATTEKPGEKPKVAPAAAQPATKADKPAAAVAPAEGS